MKTAANHQHEQTIQQYTNNAVHLMASILKQVCKQGHNAQSANWNVVVEFLLKHSRIGKE